MSNPPVPSEATPRPGETLVGQWDFRLELHDSPVAHLLSRVVLTDRCLAVLQLPTVRTVSGLAGRLSRRRSAQEFMGEMGRWHVMLDEDLSELPEPTLARAEAGRPSPLPSHLALVLGTRQFPVGEDASAVEMVEAVRERWGAQRRSRDARLA